MDTFSPQKRSSIMRQVRSKDTSSEKKVRSILHKLGFRYTLNNKKLPGSPDIVLPRYKTVIFVHGCFWHRHLGCKRASIPSSRQEYWLPKFERTVARDKSAKKQLHKMGWKVIIIWECELKYHEKLSLRLQKISTNTCKVNRKVRAATSAIIKMRQ